MLIDSGADITLVPRSVAQQLGAISAHERLYELAGFDGSIALVAAVRLELILLGRSFRGSFLVLDEESGILGRNVLNSLTISLDGPRLVWDIAQENGPTG
jgi:hypothetical protein